MKTKTFKHGFSEGEVSVMDVTDLDITQIKVNRNSGDIQLVYNTFDVDELENMSYLKIIELVEENGGEYKNKKQGIEFLTNL